MSIYNDIAGLQAMFDDYCVDLETGEIDEAKEAELNTLKAEILSEDIEKLCKVRENINSRIDAVKNELARLSEKKKKDETKLNRINNFIYFVLKNSGQKKIETGLFTISTRKSTSLLVDEVVFNDPRFEKIEQVKKIDKLAIKEAIKNGKNIAGCVLVEQENLQVK